MQQMWRAVACLLLAALGGGCDRGPARPSPSAVAGQTGRKSLPEMRDSDILRLDLIPMRSSTPPGWLWFEPDIEARADPDFRAIAASPGGRLVALVHPQRAPANCQLALLLMGPSEAKLRCLDRDPMAVMTGGFGPAVALSAQQAAVAWPVQVDAVGRPKATRILLMNPNGSTLCAASIPEPIGALVFAGEATLLAFVASPGGESTRWQFRVVLATCQLGDAFGPEFSTGVVAGAQASTNGTVSVLHATSTNWQVSRFAPGMTTATVAFDSSQGRYFTQLELGLVRDSAVWVGTERSAPNANGTFELWTVPAASNVWVHVRSFAPVAGAHTSFSLGFAPGQTCRAEVVDKKSPEQVCYRVACFWSTGDFAGYAPLPGEFGLFPKPRTTSTTSGLTVWAGDRRLPASATSGTLVWRPWYLVGVGAQPALTPTPPTCTTP